jgi:hypothetical protein
VYIGRSSQFYSAQSNQAPYWGALKRPEITFKSRAKYRWYKIRKWFRSTFLARYDENKRLEILVEQLIKEPYTWNFPSWYKNFSKKDQKAFKERIKLALRESGKYGGNPKISWKNLDYRF